MILVQNIYYMLSYAFQVLNEQGYRDVATESFENVADLCAGILTQGIAVQIRRGLGREYIEQTEELSTLRGRIEMSESVRARSMQRGQMVCTYDEFLTDSYLNRILKTTMELLLRADIMTVRKKKLRQLLIYFRDIGTLDVNTIHWDVQYNRNNQTYRMLISVCYLVIKGLLQTRSDGTTRLMDFLDDQRMSHLYEKFILEYYRKEHPELEVNASQIPWALDDGIGTLLPVMQSDIMLTQGSRVLIIDAKYYTHTMQTYYDANTVRSNNIYQIFTYVKNKDAEFGDRPHTVSGMLLYARTDEEIQPDTSYPMSGNKISIKTLDLNREFSEIAAQLNAIVEEHFDVNGNIYANA